MAEAAPAAEEEEAMTKHELLWLVQNGEHESLTRSMVKHLQGDLDVLHASIKHDVPVLFNLSHAKRLVSNHGERGYTALHWAVYYERWHLINQLMSAAAGRNALNDDNQTPLSMAPPNVPLIVAYQLVTLQTLDTFLEVHPALSDQELKTLRISAGINSAHQLQHATIARHSLDPAPDNAAAARHHSDRDSPSPLFSR